ncbi:MAG TPA: DUF2059 domain-containing protein [Phenylobacterium sp.]|jgi:hypothetical protein
MNLRRLAAGLTAAVAVLAGSPAVCADTQAPATAASAHNLELAKRLFTGMHMDQLMAGMMKNMIPVMIEQARKSNPALSQAQAEAVSAAVTESSQVMMSKLTDRMIPIYAATFSEKELQDLVTFYEGPTGQAMLAKMPVLMSKMTPMMAELMPEMQADVRQRLCAKIDCKNSAPAAPKT